MPSLPVAQKPERAMTMVALDRLAAATDELLRLELDRLRRDPAAALELVRDAENAVLFARKVIDDQHQRHA